MCKPIRVQMKRSKGWKMPANTVYVGRQTKWGNPFKVKRCGELWCVEYAEKDGQILFRLTWDTKDSAIKSCLRLYYKYIKNSGGAKVVHEIARIELRGKNLACWCPLDLPCHADVLLKIANPS